MNNYNLNWLFNPPNLFGMQRTPNRNFSHNTSHNAPASETTADSASAAESRHEKTAESKFPDCPDECECQNPESQNRPCECGKPGPMGPRGEPGPPGCPGGGR